MARLPYLDVANASEKVREVFAQLPRELNIFRLMAHAEDNFRPWVRLGASILSKQKLSAKLRELTILQIGKQCPAEYEFVQHVPIAKACGVSDEQIAAIEKRDSKAACFDAEEQAVLQLVTELLASPRASDAALSDLQKHLSPREIVELILTVGYYTTLARLMETSEIDLDEPVGTKIIPPAGS